MLLKHSLGIARKDMPQIRSANVPEFLKWLKTEHGIGTRNEKIPADKLKPIQREVNMDKVRALPTGHSSDKPMIVSKDNYILDGHHRWMQAVMAGEQLSIIRVNVGMLELLKLSKEFPKAEFHSIAA